MQKNMSYNQNYYFSIEDNVPYGFADDLYDEEQEEKDADNLFCTFVKNPLQIKWDAEKQVWRVHAPHYNRVFECQKGALIHLLPQIGV